MADTFQGTLNRRTATKTQINQARSLNTSDAKIEDSNTGRMSVDLEGLNGTITLK